MDKCFLRLRLTVCFVVFTTTIASYANAQNSEVDSLISSLKSLKDDTNKLSVLADIAEFADDGVWQGYNDKLGQLAEKLRQSDNPAIKKYAKRAYATYMNNMAFLYAEKGDYSSTLACFDTVTKLQNETGDIKGLCLTFSSIGAVYDRQGESGRAMQYYQSALRNAEKLNPEIIAHDMTAILNNIAVIYSRNKETQKEMECYRRAEKIVVKYKLSNQIVPTLYIGIGNNLNRQGNTNEALIYFQKALDVANKIGDNKGKATGLEKIASLYYQQGKVNEALLLAKQSLDISQKAQYPASIESSGKLLKEIYQKKGDFKSAFEMYNIEITARDSLQSKENQKAVIRHQIKSDYELKQAKLKAEQEKKDILTRQEFQKQRLIRNSVTGGLAVVLVFLGLLFRQRNKIAKAKKRSDELLLNILPEEVADELKQKGFAEAKQFDEVTVMFTDFKGFTQISEHLSPAELVAEIHTCFMAFDNIITKYNIEKIKTIGDSYMCAGGLPVANSSHACDVVHAALEIQQFMQEHLRRRLGEGKDIFEVRIGIHTGPVVAGIVGVKKFAYDIWGDTVNLASRMESSGEAGKVNISETTYAQVKDVFLCTARGKVEAKNKGKVEMYFVERAA